MSPRTHLMQHRGQALPLVTALCASIAGAWLQPAQASSHREAPFITTAPKVDGTDFYMFNSYETGRGDYVTLLANYQPLQSPYGGPNYFKMDPNGLYEIHIDNNGDAREDITFQFRFRNKLNSITLPIGGVDVAIPLTQAGAATAPNSANLNVNETFSVDVRRGDRRTGSRQAITNAAGGSATFDKPSDNIGTKTIPNYPAYAAQHIYNVNIPGCAMPGKLFVGQRKDPFAIGLGMVFDLINAPLSVITDPALINAGANVIDDSNVTTLAMEVHKSCLIRRRRPGDRRLDHGEPAPGQLARPDSRSRAPDDVAAHRRRVDAGVACGHAARERSRDRPAGERPLQQFEAERRCAVR